MAAIRGTNTKPELAVRRALHAAGFRFRLHVARLSGTPDLVLPKFRAVVFVHGCFFHLHECSLFKWPRTRARFWRSKIRGNRDRDRRTIEVLLHEGWRVAIIWQCGLRPAHVDRSLL